MCRGFGVGNMTASCRDEVEKRITIHVRDTMKIVGENRRFMSIKITKDNVMWNVVLCDDIGDVFQGKGVVRFVVNSKYDNRVRWSTYFG